jgi:hypothetical protein
MVATADVGKLAASLLQQNWAGKRVVELEGHVASRQMILPALSRKF